jgi:hypothetical protein
MWDDVNVSLEDLRLHDILPLQILEPGVFREEAANTSFIVFGLTRSGLEPTIYCTRGEHANNYTTDAVLLFMIPK